VLMREKVETELKFLKTQLNPHFLFNTLNNLYYLASVKSDKAPQAILALSKVLDYVLKEGKSTFVPLNQELESLTNYVALELLRYEDRVDVEVDVKGQVEEFTIGPMILITLMENAFKHGVMPNTSRSWIKMSVECDEKKMTIRIRNGCKNEDRGHGIGLENLSAQLAHLYGERFRLFIQSDHPEEFSVTLTVTKGG
jgi:two-component system LytT family sensor kinase